MPSSKPILLVAFGTLALAACSSDGTKEDSNAGSAAETVVQHPERDDDAPTPSSGNAGVDACNLQTAQCINACPEDAVRNPSGAESACIAACRTTESACLAKAYKAIVHDNIQDGLAVCQSQNDACRERRGGSWATDCYPDEVVCKQVICDEGIAKCNELLGAGKCDEAKQDCYDGNWE